jgi:hypothetical protein
MPPTGLVPVEANVEVGLPPHSTSFTIGTRPVGSPTLPVKQFGEAYPVKGGD